MPARKRRGPTRSKHTTLQDIADEMGVGRGTVSKALNTPPQFRSKLQSDIAFVAAENNYVHPSQRALTPIVPLRKSVPICIVLVGLDDLSNIRFLGEVIESLNVRDHDVATYVARRKGDEYGMIRGISEKTRQRHVCILIGSDFDGRQLYELRKTSFRIIPFLIPHHLHYLDTVAFDFEQAGENAAQFFYDHRRDSPLLLLDRNNISVSNAVQEGFTNELSKTHITKLRTDIIDKGYQETRQYISDLLDDSLLFDFVLCVNDYHAQAAIHSSLVTSVGASENLDVISLGNLLWGDLPPNPLTATLLDMQSCVREVVEIACQVAIDIEAAPVSKEISSTLIRNRNLNW